MPGSRFRRLAPALVALSLVASARVSAQARPHTPAPASPERRAIMDALRAPMQRELRKPVIFEVRTLRVLGAWAFVDAVPRRPGGAPFDYRGTPYQEAIDEGMFDDGIFAVLRRGRDGVWRVLRYAIGATDVAWIAWEEELGAPRAIFPYP
ncbi:MAG TPA: hypothetical protein VEW03_05230 [Longimicrobiaceae bacterium]|nr:hypothetical protein [Longimicrobiaceae bacterium]